MAFTILHCADQLRRDLPVAAFQITTWPMTLVANVRASGEKAAQSALLPSSVSRSLRVAVSQSLVSPGRWLMGSPLPLRSDLPSGENATERTQHVCPRRI